MHTYFSAIVVGMSVRILLSGERSRVRTCTGEAANSPLRRQEELAWKEGTRDSGRLVGRVTYTKSEAMDATRTLAIRFDVHTYIHTYLLPALVALWSRALSGRRMLAA